MAHNPRSGRAPLVSPALQRPAPVLSLFLCALLKVPAASDVCVDYELYLRVAGTYFSGGSPEAIVVVGDEAFLAARHAGLEILDVSNPLNPTLLGSVETDDQALDVAVSDPYVYIADRSDGLKVIDASDRSAPVIVGSTDMPSSTTDVVVDGSIVYLPNASGLHVVDVSTPSIPEIIGYLPTADSAYEIAVDGAIGYVAERSYGLIVLDLSDPTTPTPIGGIDLGSAFHLAHAGDYVYLGQYNEQRLYVIDVSTPTMPSVVGQVDLPSQVISVTLDGTYAYVALGGSGGYRGPAVVDVSDPTNPVIVGLVHAGKNVAVKGNVAFACDSDHVAIIDVSTKQSVPALSSLDLGDVGWGVAARGRYAYVAGERTLYAVDLIDPTNPQTTGTVDLLTQSASTVTVEGNHVYVSADHHGLRVHDISTPSQPVFISSILLGDRVVGHDTQGSVAYVGTADEVLHVVDISDPSSMQPITSTPLADFPSDLDVDGNLLIATGQSVSAYDVSNPASPVLLNNRELSSDGVALDGPLAYIAGAWDGFYVLNAATLDEISHVLTADRAWDASIAGTKVYVGDLRAGVQVIDVSDPRNPRRAGSVVFERAYYPFAHGDIVLAATGADGLSIVPAHCDVATPVAMSGLEATATDASIELRWRARAGHFAAFNVARSAAAGASDSEILTTMPGTGSAFSYVDRTAVAGVRYAYRIIGVDRYGATETLGPVFAEAGAAPTPRATLLAIAPNPMKTRTTLDFVLPEAARVLVRVHDVAGRLVRDVEPGRLGAGRHFIVWDGTSDQGLPVGQGIYFVTLSADRAQSVQRVVVLR